MTALPVWRGAVAKSAYADPPISWPNTISADSWTYGVTLSCATGRITATHPGLHDYYGSLHTALRGVAVAPVYVPSLNVWRPGNTTTWNVQPELLLWTGVTPITREELIELMYAVQPLATELLHALDRELPGGGYDWTGPAVAYARRIRDLVANPGAPAPPVTSADFAGIVSFTNVLANRPEVAHPIWRWGSDADLHQLADDLARPRNHLAAEWLTGPIAEQLRTEFALPPLEPITVVGYWAGLLRYRDQAVRDETGRQPVDAARWFAGPEGWPAELTADTTDSELDGIAYTAKAHGKERDVTLIAVAEVLRDRRRELRAQVRAQLKATGTRIGELQQTLERARRERVSALLQVLAWADEEDLGPGAAPNLARLADLAGMTRQALGQMLDRLLPGQGTDQLTDADRERLTRVGMRDRRRAFATAAAAYDPKQLETALDLFRAAVTKFFDRNAHRGPVAVTPTMIHEYYPQLDRHWYFELFDRWVLGKVDGPEGLVIGWEQEPGHYVLSRKI